MTLETIYVLLNAYYFPHGFGMSGGDRRAIEMLRRWPHDGNTRFVVIGPEKVFTILKREGVDGFGSVVTSEGHSEDQNIFSAYRIHTKNALHYVKKICRGNAGDGGGQIYYSTSDYINDILPAICAKKRQKSAKWYAIIHHIIEDYHTRPGNRLHNWLAYVEQQWCIGRIIRYADRILTVSPLVYDYLKGRGVPEARLRLVSNGVDEKAVDAQKPLDDPSRHFDGVFLARFARSKGIMEFPAIWKRVTDAVPGARLCLVGDGTEETVRELREKFAEKEIVDLVVMPGYLSGGEIYSQLKSAKVFLLPSHEEGWGIVIAEAMACGLPVVTYALPVFPRIFHNINLSSRLGDTDAFADNVISLLKDEARRNELGQAGKKLVDSEYTWDKVAEREWNLLHEV